MKIPLPLLLRSILAFAFPLGLAAEIVVWDVSHLQLTTPPSQGDDSNTGNTAIGVWFNFASGEAYVVDSTAGIPGLTSLADGRFQLRWTTYWSPPSSDIVIQGDLPFNSIHGISVAAPNAAAGSPARLGPGDAVPTGAAFRPANFVEMAGTFGMWREQGRGFLAARFIGPGDFALHFGFVDITILADGSIRLNGFAYNSTPLAGLTTFYIGAPAPAPAAGLTVVGTTATAVALRWEDQSDNETGFILERRGPGQTEFTRVATTLPDVTTFVDEGLSAGTTFTYRVVATSGLDAPASNEVTATTRAVDAPPAPPANLQAMPLSPSAIRLQWTAVVADALGYRIERALGEGPFEEVVLTGPGAQSHTDIGLVQGETYRYRVKAFNGLDSPNPPQTTARTFSPRETTGVEAALAAYPEIQGGGVAVALWDFAPARSTHVEFASGGGRVRNIGIGEAGSDALSNHTTHGAGIVAASGVNPAALGLAPEARVDVRHFETDQADKRAIGMSWPGQPDTLQVALSAYGPIRGWNRVFGGPATWTFNAPSVGGQPPVRDPFLGAYTDFSFAADETAWMRPYLLQVRSAGNDRNDNPRPNEFVYLSSDDFAAFRVSLYDPERHAPGDGGYGIVSDAAAAKNTLAVGAWTGARRDPGSGALQFAGEETDFSAWGPTRDGRVKPDLVAAGVSVFSAGFASDEAYSSLTGSSQAAPQAAAAAALAVQKWSASGLGGALRASTLRALLVHTADDLGSFGPDPQTGWGLLNARAALDKIHAHRYQSGAAFIREGFHRGPPLRIPVFSDGSSPVTVTLAWTDAPGGGPGDPDSSSPRLVHDLDVRLETAAGAVLQPFVLPRALDPSADPGAPAVTGDNPVDTIEQIRASLPAGLHHIRISLKGTPPIAELPFSLIVSGAVDAGAPLPRATRALGNPGGMGLVGEIRGDGFQLGATVTARAPGSSSEVLLEGAEIGFNLIRLRDLPGGALGGPRILTIRNPDGGTAFVEWTPGPPDGFTTWLDALYPDENDRDNPDLAGPLADPLDQGYPLLLAYALGAPGPLVPPSFFPESRLAGAGGDAFFEVDFPRRALGSAEIFVEAADRPNGPWQRLPPSAILSVTPGGEGLETVRVRDTTPVNPANPARFFRLRADFR